MARSSRSTRYKSLLAVRSLKFGSTIFTQEDGLPHTFYFEDEIPDLETVINNGGGEMIKNPRKATILLCEDKSDKRIADGYLPLDFVVSCAKENSLIDADKYRCQRLHHIQPSVLSSPGCSKNTTNNSPRRTPQKSTMGSTSADENTCNSSSGGSPKRRNADGRMKFTDSDDLNIIRQLVINKRYKQINDNALWELLESLKVTKHTAQSMKARFQKKIVPEIHSYNICDRWKQLMVAAGGGDKKGEERSPFNQLDAWKEKEKQQKLKDIQNKRGLSSSEVDDEEDENEKQKEKNEQVVVHQGKRVSSDMQDSSNTQDIDEFDEILLNEANDQPPNTNVCSPSKSPARSSARKGTTLTDSDEEFFNSCNSVFMGCGPQSAYRGRMKYTDADDFKIIRHLVLHQRYKRVNGNAVWKELEALKVTGHTHQSMKARFLRQILPDIDSYEICDRWRRMLVHGDVAVSEDIDDGDGDELTVASLDAWRQREKQHKLDNYLNKPQCTAEDDTTRVDDQTKKQDERAASSVEGILDERELLPVQGDQDKRVSLSIEGDTLNTQELDEIDRMLLQEAEKNEAPVSGVAESTDASDSPNRATVQTKTTGSKSHKETIPSPSKDQPSTSRDAQQSTPKSRAKINILTKKHIKPSQSNNDTEADIPSSYTSSSTVRSTRLSKASTILCNPGPSHEKSTSSSSTRDDAVLPLFGAPGAHLPFGKGKGHKRPNLTFTQTHQRQKRIKKDERPGSSTGNKSDYVSQETTERRVKVICELFGLSELDAIQHLIDCDGDFMSALIFLDTHQI